MRSQSVRFFLALSAMGLSALPLPAFCQTSPSDKDLEAQVVRLIRQLDDLKRTEREKAQQELLELGPRALPHLPEATSPELSAEQRRRIRVVLPDLWHQRLQAEVAGSKFQIDAGNHSVTKLFEQIAEQTGVHITDMRARFNQPIQPASINLEDTDSRLWPALDTIMLRAGLGYYHFTDDRTIGVQSRQGPSGPVSYQGAFRFELQRLMLDRQFNQSDEATCGITIGIFSEPRLRPVMFELDLTKFTASDDLGNSLQFVGPQRLPLAVDQTGYHQPVSLRLSAPDRKAAKLASLEGELSVWLPSRTEEFVFDRLHEGKPVTQSTASTRVSLQGITDDEGLWVTPVIIEQLADAGPVESYLQAALENEIFLRTKDGERFEQNGGLSTFGEEPGKVGIEYLFVDADRELEEYELVLRVPAGLTPIGVPIKFTNLPLP